MARILYAWELGGGLGHLVHARTVCGPLVRAGHEVTFVLRNPLPAVRVLGTLGPFIAAPLWPPLPVASQREVISYPALLTNIGFGDGEALHCLSLAWRHTIELAQPDLVFADHAPTALVALRGMDLPVVGVGSGFFIPPPQFPLPSLRPWKPVPEKQLVQHETAVTAVINDVLDKLGAPSIAGVGDLGDLPANLLLAYPEIDHYPGRASDAAYWGVPPPPAGTAVTWPGEAEEGQKRVFAYLKPFAEIGALFDALADPTISALVYAPGLPAAVKERYASSSLLFLDVAADITQVARECDLAISHGGIGTLAFILLAGKPLLMLPLQLEQLLICRRVVELGAGVLFVEREPSKLRAAVASLLSEPDYRRAAERFADKHPWPTTERFESNLNDLVGKIL